MPTAEKVGVRMGLHPDDPCLPELGGYARIFGSVADYDRAFAIYPSESNAVTYCQANFKLMSPFAKDTEDKGATRWLIDTAKHFGKRIAFVHVRDVEGDKNDFTELFHDQGTTDQFALMRAYREIGLDVPMRGDHVPEMEGDRLLTTDCVPGYFTMGRLFANGYLKALMKVMAICCGLVLTGYSSNATPSPYGVAAHLTRSGESAPETARLCVAAGIGAVRTGVKTNDVSDAVYEVLSSNGVEWIGLLASSKLREALAANRLDDKALSEWTAEVRATAERFRGKITSWEVWNEQNIPSFWPNPNPTNYFAVLKAAYRTLKEVDPANRVAIGGFAGICLDYIETLYRLGAKDFFDVMNFHLYADHTALNLAERNFDVRIEGLKELMAKHGDGDKPFWMTETGWPTHTDTEKTERRNYVSGLIRKGVEIARPGQKGLRVGVISVEADSGRIDPGGVSFARSALSADCEVFGLRPEDAAAALDAGKVDVFWWNLSGWMYFDIDERAVKRFLQHGGTVILGYNMERCVKRDESGAWFVTPGRKAGGKLEARFKIGSKTFSDAKVPVARLRTPEDQPFTFTNKRYLTTDLLGATDALTPLYEVTDKKTGKSYPIAGVYSFDGGKSGTIIQSMVGSRFWYSSTEERQGVRLARLCGLLFAEGLERLFWYEFQERGGPCSPDSQDHFGIVTTDYKRPKPAYYAYRQFIQMRPVGSVQDAGEWHDATRTFYHPSWKRPDGKRAGLVWTIGTPSVRELDFGVKVRFFDHLGKEIEFPQVNGKHSVKVTDVPVYWVEEVEKVGGGEER